MTNETDLVVVPFLESMPLLVVHHQRSNHPYQAFVRWLAREDVLDKIAMMVLSEPLQYPINASILEKIKSQMFYFFRGSHYPRLNRSALNDLPSQRYAIANDFLNGIGNITDRIWPIVFFALQVHDFIIYDNYPQSRFGNTAGNIWLGASSNQLGFSSHLGSVLPGSTAYYFYPTLIFSASVLSGMIKRGINFKLNRLMKSLSEIYWVENFEGQRQQDLRELIQKTVEGNFFEKINALRMLAIIADKFDQKSLHLSGNREVNLEHERNQALTALKTSNQIVGKILLWSLGESNNIFVHIIFTPMALYVLYAKTRLIQIFIEKIIGLIKFYQNKSQCTELGKEWEFISNFGDYVCAVCPKWSFVFYKNIFTEQDCLNGLLSQPRLPEVILKYSETVLLHSNITRLDLSQQQFESWNEKDWGQFLNKISDKITHLHVFNLSRALVNTIPFNESFVMQLKEFMNKVIIDDLNLNNFGMGDEFMLELMPAIANASVKKLTLSGNLLTDQFIFGLNISLDNLIKLDVSQNQFDDDGISALINIINKTLLEFFSVESNAFDKSGLEALSNWLPFSHLKVCDLSGNDLSQADMDNFGKSVSLAPFLESVDVSACNLDDDAVSQFSAYFKIAHLKKVDFSGNVFGDVGLFVILNQTKGSNITAFVFNQLSITDDGLQTSSTILSQTMIEDLSFSHCQMITIDGLNQFFQTWLNASHQNLKIDLSDNALGDDIIECLFLNFNQSSAKLTSINLRNNLITDKNSEKLLKLLKDANTTEVDLSNNQMTDKTMTVFADEIQSLNLISINLGQNKISGNESFQVFVQQIPGSHLRKIFLSNNFIKDEEAKYLAQELVTPKPPMKNAGKELSIDEGKALARSRPNTHLTTVDLSSNQIGSEGGSALCEVLGFTEIPISHFNLNNNPVDPKQIDVVSCRQIFAASEIFLPEPTNFTSNSKPSGLLSSGQQNQSSSTTSAISAILIPGIGTIIIGFIAIYLIYIACKPLFNRTWNNSSSFFKGVKENDLKVKNTNEDNKSDCNGNAIGTKNVVS